MTADARAHGGDDTLVVTRAIRWWWSEGVVEPAESGARGGVWGVGEVRGECRGVRVWSMRRVRAAECERSAECGGALWSVEHVQKCSAHSTHALIAVNETCETNLQHHSRL